MNIHKENEKRCIVALILCSTVFFLVFLSVLIRVSYDGDSTYSGIANMRYFTYESNIFVGLSAFLCIPFQIDGLRNRNYHLPRWIVYLLYISVCTVTITLSLSLFIMLPTKGIHFTYISCASFLPHLVIPILSMIMFIFVNDDHEIKLSVLFYALVPVLVYGEMYIRRVFVSKEWEDHYFIEGIMPIWLTALLALSIYVIITIILRKLHNKRHQIRKNSIKEYYTNGPEVSYPTIEEAIGNLAKRNKEVDLGGDLNVPRRIILMMEEKYHSGKNIKQLCKIYLDSYYKGE